MTPFSLPCVSCTDPRRPIFVFGSNLAGIHGKGAAHHALLFHGAWRGVGEGLMGESYALPTKDQQIRTRHLTDIAQSVDRFIDCARRHPQLWFNVTRVGCGLAGYTDDQIAPMFDQAPDNCLLPPGWRSEATNRRNPYEEPI